LSATLLRPLARGAAALVLALAAVALAAAAGAAPKPVTHTVTIDATSYLPKTVTVAVGDSVVWVNKDILVHTVTARDSSFDSQDIQPGKSWTYTVKATGLSAYHCVYHTTMKGTLRVR
jgi:plastocyanin